MKLILLLLLITPIFWSALRQKKWYLWLTFAFYGLLPDTFAIELSGSLPLLTAQRVMVLILLAIWVLRSKGHMKLGHLRPILIYMVINILISLVDLRYGSGEINKLFILIVEQLLFIIVVTSFIRTREEVSRALDYMVAGGVVQSLIGILQTVARYDLSTVLNLIQSRGEVASASVMTRMGLARAGGTMGAIQLGSYCAILILITLYRYETTKKAKYIVAAALEALAMCCSMSRSSIGPLILILVVMFFGNIKRFLRIYGKYLALGAGAVLMLLVVSSGVRDAVFGVIASMLRTLGLQVSVSGSFGANVSGFASRFMQWTVIPYMFTHGGFLFGLGYRAYMRGKLYYYYPQFSGWFPAVALDVGVAAIFSESGLVGTLNWLVLVGYLLAFARKRRKDAFYRCFFYTMCLYVLLNIFTSFTTNGTVWLLWCAFFAYKRLGKEQRSNAAHA